MKKSDGEVRNVDTTILIFLLLNFTLVLLILSLCFIKLIPFIKMNLSS